ncbi:hypothetical protein SAMN04488057_1282 [Cyclobacterium lianum]|uniref:SH3b domain-containing protein n=1 Tax=Cyclobacterium lianum TaxID=388280 RepID=A0A1M7QV50_9BACT|nr:hypothetical protein [Cyclobacterium lianum]SHN35587.1 hypothetical protein SAMN04488057_1282 [Cyclobacterium lianum]
MPNLRWIFIVFLLLFPLLSTLAVDSQGQDPVNLQHADSLFAQKQYQEALEIYEHLLHEKGTYSPAMLLKMGFIAEGVGDFGQASLYLSKYYEHYPNPAVTDKIKSLTNQARLEGYDVSDQDRFLGILVNYKTEITAGFAFLLLLSLIMIFLVREKRSGFYFPAFVFLLLTFVSNNFIRMPETAIITGTTVLIMDAPSAASNLLRRVQAGHRITIHSNKDMWYEIEWDNRKAYIRKSDVSKI